MAHFLFVVPLCRTSCWCYIYQTFAVKPQPHIVIKMKF